MTTFSTTRDIAAGVTDVFSAIAEPGRLARWWGPAGFTNTFHACDVTPGGRWSFVMHGPDGTSYPNENLFEDIVVPTRVVIRHVSEPRFRLTIALSANAGGTRVSWAQAFDSAETARRIEHIVVPANEQNLDRLAAEVSRCAPGAAAP